MTLSDESDRPPQSHPERFEWICARARMLESRRDEDWIEDRLRWLWDHPDEFVRSGMPDAPEGIDKDDYLLFKMGVLFGTEFEHEFPRAEYDGEVVE